MCWRFAARRHAENLLQSFMPLAFQHRRRGPSQIGHIVLSKPKHGERLDTGKAAFAGDKRKKQRRSGGDNSREAKHTIGKARHRKNTEEERNSQRRL